MDRQRIRELLDAGKPNIAATVYIAAVCYPYDQPGTDKYLLAQRAYVAKTIRDRDELYADDPSRLMDSRSMMRTLEKTKGILMDRFEAVLAVALPVIFDGANNAAFHISPAAPSPNAAMRQFFAWKSEHKSEANQRSDAENYRQRTWKQTQPVLHLANAMMSAVSWRDIETASSAGILAHLIFNPQWVEPALKGASVFLTNNMRAGLTTPSDNIVIFDA